MNKSNRIRVISLSDEIDRYVTLKSVQEILGEHLSEQAVGAILSKLEKNAERKVGALAGITSSYKEFLDKALDVIEIIFAAYLPRIEELLARWEGEKDERLFKQMEHLGDFSEILTEGEELSPEQKRLAFVFQLHHRLTHLLMAAGVDTSNSEVFGIFYEIFNDAGYLLEAREFIASLKVLQEKTTKIKELLAAQLENEVEASRRREGEIEDEINRRFASMRPQFIDELIRTLSRDGLATGLTCLGDLPQSIRREVEDLIFEYT